MNVNDFCAPALLYVAFSLTHIIVDLFKQMYNTALVKFIVMIIFTFLLNLLCQRGLTVISWFIVFIPFITMTVITTLLLIIFGLSPFTGKVKKSHLQPEKPPGHDEKPHHHKSCHNKSCHNKSCPHKKFRDKHHAMNIIDSMDTANAMRQHHEKFYN